MATLTHYLRAREREREKELSTTQQPTKKRRTHTSPSRARHSFLFEPASSAMSQQRRMMMRRRRLSSSASRDEDECERREKLVEKRKEATIRKQIERVRRHKKRQQQRTTTTFPSRSASERRRGGAEEDEESALLLFSSRSVYFFARVVFVVGVLLLAFFSLKEFEIGRRQRSQILVFTRERLRASPERNYLSVAGEVFDVSGGNGDLFYGEGKEYNFFVGTDQTKGFLTGKREESNVDVETLTNGEVLEIEKWVRFYRRGGSKGAYRKRGVLGDGWFYDERGEKTARAIRFWERVEEAKEEAKREEEEEESNATPLCRAAWTEERGGTVWCDPGEDATVTYPRLNAKNGLCECHEDQGYSDLRKLYENCDAKSTRCFTG